MACSNKTLLRDQGSMNKNSEVKVFHLEWDSTVGRYLVANRDIEPGEIIIDEPSIIMGPIVLKNSQLKMEENNSFKKSKTDCGMNRDTTENILGTPEPRTPVSVCCVCFEACQLHQNYKCKTCLCSLFCSRICASSATHTENECRIFSYLNKCENDLKLKLLKIEYEGDASMCNVISTIRCLFVRYRNPIHWLQICQLQSKVKELEKVNAFNLLDSIFIRLQWKHFTDVDDGNHDKSDKEGSLVDAARHCLGMMRMNAYSHVKNSVGFEGLYFFTALMSHSCIMNTDRNFDLEREGRMVVKAATKILQGEALTTTYLCLMDNTKQRQADMKSNWFFSCSCKRCRDDTELGTFMSTVLMPDSVAEHDNDFQSETKTILSSSVENNLNVTISKNNADEVVERIRSYFPMTKNTTTSCINVQLDTLELLLQKFDNGKYLHSNHSVFSQVKLYLCLSYGRQHGGMEGLKDLQLLRKYHLCCEILQIYDKIYPGIYQCKGELLFELWSAMKEMKKRGLQTSSASSQSSYNLRIANEENVAYEAHKILKYAVQNSSPYKMKKFLIDEYPFLEIL